ncbi:spore maturation protein [Desulforamulus hydrothermalis]|uniref:Spore maturation protein B n=1 Tax=Desulforamulus hydrothermalis Lam5 = DSM 18033 TaxID=1121428 RepID=K8E0C5_9FIRM|nr:spore maturation protein [Desulforamulus hydrothermalis]CCO09004.1 Spore maturation protein B [Desulforamulus hydrothermalis Lam5 = DSM 18033]SHG76726.1 spore maturation protein B [Desulforamulus hydrothermalis Lam5 = DSM 18033]
MYEVINQISRWAVPVILLLVPLAAFIRKVPVFETFVEGAEDGFATAVKTIPYLTAMLVAVSVFRASGAMELLAAWLAPVLTVSGLPADILPHALMRPLSGGAALGIATEVIKTHGPDSFVGRLVSTMQGSSDTTFYILTLYFGSVGVRKYRYAVASGLAADFTTLLASVFICKLMF